MSNENKIEEFFDFCKSYILQEIDEHEGRDEYICDLGISLTECMRVDGTFTYSTAKAKEYLMEWFYEAGKYSDYENSNFGKRSNPFNNVEAFLVNMVSEGVWLILSRCQFIEDNCNKNMELNKEIIAIIKEQVEEQSDDELF